MKTKGDIKPGMRVRQNGEVWEIVSNSELLFDRYPDRYPIENKRGNLFQARSVATGNERILVFEDVMTDEYFAGILVET